MWLSFKNHLISLIQKKNVQFQICLFERESPIINGRVGKYGYTAKWHSLVYGQENIYFSVYLSYDFNHIVAISDICLRYWCARLYFRILAFVFNLQRNLREQLT